MTSIVSTFDDWIEKYTAQIYFITLGALHIAYILVFFNITRFNEAILNYTDVAIQTFICAVLLLRFNPWRKVQITEYDKHIIFGTALILLGNLASAQYFLKHFKTFYDKQYKS
jgi:tryptophan-rich sensory protein